MLLELRAPAKLKDFAQPEVKILRVRGSGAVDLSGVHLPNLEAFVACRTVFCEGFIEMLHNAPNLRSITCSLPYVDNKIAFPSHANLRNIYCLSTAAKNTRIDMSRLTLDDISFDHIPYYLHCGNCRGGEDVEARIIEGKMPNPNCCIYIGEGWVEPADCWGKYLATAVFRSRNEFERAQAVRC